MTNQVPLTPMMEQYRRLKEQYPDAILFFRLGDFYEMFFEDAVKAARELEITLTGRDAGAAGRVPMCGVPHHAAQGYIARLVHRGYRVAICEQVEDPRSARGLVKREVVRLVTPGTLVEEDRVEHNFLAALVPADRAFGLAVADIGTGSFNVYTFDSWAQVLDEIQRLQPSEILLPRDLASDPDRRGQLESVVRTTLTPLEQTEGQAECAPGEDPGACAGRVLLAYVRETQRNEARHLAPEPVDPARHMYLDAVTRRNLELTRSLRDGGRWGTLLWVLDHTVTAMGARLLRHWIEQPLLEPAAIERRLEAVEELARETALREEVRGILKRICDLERLAARVAFGSAGARDLLNLKAACAALPNLLDFLRARRAALWQALASRLDPLEDLTDLLERALAEDPPATLREGGLIRPGFHEEVDRLREIRADARRWLADLEARERERTGIKSLKVGYNKVFGYYIEVTRANLGLVPGDYERRQTLAGAERFVTPELKHYESLVLSAEERLVELEYQLFTEIRDRVACELRRVQQSARVVARADVLYSLAEAAARGRYVRPVVNDSGRIIINEGRHPVLERVLGPGGFVPNDAHLDERRRLVILTGPNMAGKSTYMRQVGLIVLMAQMGSFVPAAAAEIGIVDRIFTRAGASDDLAGGRSTFMVEMEECRAILLAATDRSLVIMDEVGRGTSTYDGISIARALLEHLHKHNRPKILFSTHFHELTDLERLPGAVNYTVAVREEQDRIIFLRRVIPGKADKSYGIQVASLAGLPEEVITRAKEILRHLELKRRKPLPAGQQLQLFTPQAAEVHPVLRELRALDLGSITPIEALNRLYGWQSLLREGERG